MRNLFFGLFLVGVAFSAHAQEARPVLTAQYYQALGFRVAQADPWVFESRVLPGAGSKCTGSPNGFSVAFYSGGLRHLVTSDCNIPGVFASSNGHTYVDMNMDGKIDLVSIEYWDRTSKAVFYGAEFAPALNLDRRDAYQREFEAVLAKLEAKMADI
jgi:hypothetical protein